MPNYNWSTRQTLADLRLGMRVDRATSTLPATTNLPIFNVVGGRVADVGDEVFRLIGIGLIGIIADGVVNILLVRLIGQPLESLADQVRSVGQGDFDHICIVYDVLIGKDVAVSVDDHTGSQGRVLLEIPFRTPKELLEPIPAER